VPSRARSPSHVGNVGMRERGDGNYTARAAQFWVHPGSWVKKGARWIMRAICRDDAAVRPLRRVIDLRSGWKSLASSIKSGPSGAAWEKGRGRWAHRARARSMLPVYSGRP